MRVLQRLKSLENSVGLDKKENLDYSGLERNWENLYSRFQVSALVKLELVDENYFDIFFECMIKEYAKESVLSGKWNKNEAINRARTEAESNLPEKHKTPGHYIYKISNESNDIGYIWAGSTDPKKKNVFVYAFEIYFEFRNQGNGKKSFQLLENKMKNMGFEKITLNVFEKSDAALNIYKSLDYKTRSRIMTKALNN